MLENRLFSQKKVQKVKTDYIICFLLMFKEYLHSLKFNL